MRTYSALGILKNATDKLAPKIEFVTAQQYEHIRKEEKWNEHINHLNYYTLLPSDLDTVDCSVNQKSAGDCEDVLPEEKEWLDAQVVPWIQDHDLTVYEKPSEDVLSNTYIDFNGRLGTLRRYILIIVDDQSPEEPVYVSYTDGKRWYYIADDDAVSAKNFQLLSLLTTMMAIPPTSQPLTPVINVGG